MAYIMKYDEFFFDEWNASKKELFEQETLRELGEESWGIQECRPHLRLQSL